MKIVGTEFSSTEIHYSFFIINFFVLSVASSDLHLHGLNAML
jgi:hypothetical protein